MSGPLRSLLIALLGCILLAVSVRCVWLRA